MFYKRFSIGLIVSLLIMLSFSPSIFAQGNTNIYRLFNGATGEHLYTSDQYEAQVLSSSQGWTDEGIGWIAPESGTAVIRLFNPSAGDHLYTTDGNEVSVLTRSQGWQADYNGQPLFYSDGSIPVYRLFNPSSGRHHLTTDAYEYNVLSGQGWRQEGVALYALSAGVPKPAPDNNINNGTYTYRNGEYLSEMTVSGSGNKTINIMYWHRNGESSSDFEFLNIEWKGFGTTYTVTDNRSRNSQYNLKFDKVADGIQLTVTSLDPSHGFWTEWNSKNSFVGTYK